MKKLNKNISRRALISIIALIVLVIVFFVTYQFLRPRGNENAKTIQFSVIVGDETIESIDIHTYAEYLRQALEDEELIEGDKTTYGLWVTTVAGRLADSDKEEWWSLYKNGEFSMTGVDDTPLEDGDNIEYRLTVGYN